MAFLKACALVALCALVSTQVARAQPYANVAEVLSFTAPGIAFTVLGQLVAQTNLTATLSDPNLKAVVLAPTDAAFERLTASLGEAAAANLTSNTTILKNILTYHVLPMATPGLPPLGSSLHPTVAGPNVTAVNNNGSITFYASAPGAKPVAGVAPVTAGQSIVVVMDSVLVPPTANETIASAGAKIPALSMLLQLASSDDVIMSVLGNPDATVTLFAPSTDALMALTATTNMAALQAAARGIMLTHVVPTRPWLSTELPNGTTSAVPTANGNQTLTITNTGGTVTVAGAGNTVAAKVTEANYKAGKSVIHVIDRVIMPGTTAPSTSPPAASSPPPPAGGAATANAANILAMAGVALASLLAMIAL